LDEKRLGELRHLHCNPIAIISGSGAHGWVATLEDLPRLLQLFLGRSCWCLIIHHLCCFIYSRSSLVFLFSLSLYIFSYPGKIFRLKLMDVIK
jgi:hypothetical protein